MRSSREARSFVLVSTFVAVAASQGAAAHAESNPAGPVLFHTTAAAAAQAGVAPAGSAPLCGTHTLAYTGGPIMSGQTHLYIIYYGSLDAIFNGQQSDVNPYLQALSESSYMAMNTTYGDSTGHSVLGQFTVTESYDQSESQGSSLTSQNAVENVVLHAINVGNFNGVSVTKLPLDTNGVYIVITADGVSQSNASNSAFCGSGPNAYCGWHTNGTINNADIKYGFVGSPDNCTECQWPSAPPVGTGFGSGISTLTHEIEETLTDPDLNAWHNGNTEDADLCAWTAGATYTTSSKTANFANAGGQFLVQAEWVNENGGYGANAYALPFWGQNYGYKGLPAGDWANGSYKAQCSESQPVIGVSENPNENNVHGVLCGNGIFASNYPQESCHGVLFDPGNNMVTNPEGDWDPGYYKAECGASEYVAGVSQSTSGEVDGILCCSGHLTRSDCAANELLYGQNSQDYVGPDWDASYYKGQCPAGQYTAGVSAVASGSHTGAAHRLLCCPPIAF